ncbi:MAG: hypothetical protein P8Q95_01030 [Candidatus Poseidoniaceae archaeon]|nr:hypothetical protein [Candidatus Poseidoniaceae archaeon]
MDLDGYSDTTTSFFTIDACDGDLAKKIMSVLSLTGEDLEQSWKQLISKNPEMESRLRSQGIDSPEIRGEIEWDDAVILFTCTLKINNQNRPIQLGEQLSKERFGRFPWGDGSATKYLIEYLRPNNSSISSKESYDKMMNLLERLNSYCIKEPHGDKKYTNGLGGLNICGILDMNEAHELRKYFTGRMWSVSADEPLDGGVRDAIKHLVLILKSAERRGVGVMLRSHA